ncbi:glycosyltransferase family 9 protein [Rhizobium leucaenae]|uniref:glycosyltransferase family 9 protein n=1 Tax=Rhizobium leucaenae TaxID=29450 RepID=UPI0007EE3410|nr:glycosyltransferase family 9 protein [Rhizobium leucaenae]MBB6305168.1 ADP-heptose:LPS heptosyltransferase [Rhizobium leucaenae]
MKKKHKLLVDQFFGYALTIVLRIPALILESILRRDHAMPPSKAPKKIVVAKYLGIGSILQTTPMLKGLKEKYPDAQLIFLSLKSNRALLSRYEFVDDIICVDDSSLVQVCITSLRAIFELISRKIDLFIDLEVYSTYGSLMCLLSCSENRLGFSRQDTDYKAFMYTHLLYLNTNFPMRHCYNQLGQVAGMDTPPANAAPICPALSETDEANVRQRMETIFDFEHKGIIALNANASDLRYERRWSREDFAAVARHFAREGYAIALVGSPAEHEYVQGIVELLGNDAGKVRNVAGLFSLLEFFSFLGKCSLLVTNDSGVMNMALALSVPQLLLSGPVNPDQYFIPNEFRTYIYYQTYCSPCTHYIENPPCAGNNVCMQQIRSKEVVAVCERLLRGEHVVPKRSIYSSHRSDVLGVLKDKGKL